MRYWISASKYEVPVPTGAPPAIFIPLYADALRKQLVSLLGAGGYDIRIEKNQRDKYTIHVLRGAFSGMEVTVQMKPSLLAHGSQAEIRVDASSKTEQILMKVFAGLMLLVAIPVFLMLLFSTRLFFALIGTFIALIPLVIICGLLNAAVMASL